MKRYRHLFFDLDNTLYDFYTNSYLAMKDAFSSLGLMEKLESFDRYFEIYQRINEQLWADYRNKQIVKEELRKKRFAESLKEYRIDNFPDPLEIDNCYLSFMALKTELFPGTLDVVSELKRRNYQLHIITNGFREVQHHKLANTGLISFFGKIFISEDLKTTKPSPEIFEYALKSCNARKKESLMIGDSWETDVAGAQKSGIDQVYFIPFGEEYPFSEHERPTFIIRSLHELLTILE